MAWDSGTITSATPWETLSSKLRAMVGGAGVENWSVERVPAGTGQGQSGSASYALDVFKCRGTNAQVVPVNMVNKLSTSNTTDAATFNFNPGLIDPTKGYLLSVINTKAAAADQPSSVAFSGVNAPILKLLKTQAGAAGGEARVSTYLAAPTFADAFLPTAIDDSAFPPSQDDENFFAGTSRELRTLTVVFPATQTGIIVIMEEVSGLDWSQDYGVVGATGVATQAIGAQGTSETSHTGTLAALGSNTVTYAVAGQTASTTAYTTEWVPTSADVVLATPAAHARAMWQPDNNDTAGLLTSGGTVTSWAYVALELKRAPVPAPLSLPTLNDCGNNWYFVIEVPVTDGAVATDVNAAEEFETGAKVFGGMAFAGAATTPSSSRYWSQTGYNLYANYTNNTRASYAMNVLNTSGFQYYIKLTKNAVLISTRVSGTETSAYAGLIDSFVVNATDRVPLSIHVSPNGSTTGSSFTSLPGILALTGGTASRGWQASSSPWTHNVLNNAANEGGSLFNNTLATNVDAWQAGKTYVARIVEWHAYSQTSGTVASTAGFYRGLVKGDFLCIASGGTVQVGDTMVVGGVTWTVIKTVSTHGTGGQSMAWITRPI